MTKVAINGLGRMGKLVLRAFIDEGLQGEIVLLNDPAGTPEQHALLMEFDTVHGRWAHDFGWTGDSVSIDGRAIRLTQAARIEDLPLAELGVDLVVDGTGVFKTEAKTQPYFDAGVTKVVVSAPVKDEGVLNVVYGVNHALYDPATHHLVTAASCTTNCLAPVVKVIHEGLGIRHGSMTTVHDVTNTQVMASRSRAPPPPRRSTRASRRPPKAPCRASSATRNGRWSRPITSTTRAPRSSTRRRRWW